MSRKDQILSLLAASPDDSFLLFALAKEHEKAGDAPAAHEVYVRLVRDFPRDPGTYYHLGKLQEKMDDPAAADATYALGIKTTKELGEAHAMRELMGARMELGWEEE